MYQPDMLFLDIEMPGMTGLQVAAHASRKCHVVFVTAYDKYAIAAFEQGAADYVLKPFSPSRLATTVLRLKERITARPADLDGLLRIAGAARPGAEAIAAMGQGFAGPERPARHGRRGALLPAPTTSTRSSSPPTANS